MGVFDKFIGIIGNVVGNRNQSNIDVERLANEDIKKKMEEERQRSEKGGFAIPLGGALKPVTPSSTAMSMGNGVQSPPSTTVPSTGAVQPPSNTASEDDNSYGYYPGAEKYANIDNYSGKPLKRISPDTTLSPISTASSQSQPSLVAPVQPPTAPVETRTEQPQPPTGGLQAGNNAPDETGADKVANIENYGGTPSYAESREARMGAPTPVVPTAPGQTPEQKTNAATEQLVGGLLRTGVADTTGMTPAPATPTQPGIRPVPKSPTIAATDTTNYVQPAAPGQPTQVLGARRQAALAKIPKIQASGADRPINVTEQPQISKKVTYRPFETVAPPKGQELKVGNVTLGVATKDGQKVLVDKYGSTVGNLSDYEKGVYGGKRVAVVGNDVVDLEGNKVTDFKTAYKDRDFRYEYTKADIDRRMEAAVQSGDTDAQARLNREQAAAELDWKRSRPKDTTRSWKELFKTIGASALRGYAAGGLGGAIAGAGIGATGYAISPEFGQRMMDTTFRLPSAEAKYQQAVAQEKQSLEASKGRTLNLKENQELQNTILEGRKRALDSNPYWQRFTKGETLTAPEIAEMERTLGYATGVRPGVSLNQQMKIVNGVLYGYAPDGTLRKLTDENGIPVFDLTKTVVEVVDPTSGAKFYVSSEEEAKRQGTWALEQFKAQVRQNIAASRPRITPEGIRTIENQIETARQNIDLLTQDDASADDIISMANATIKSLEKGYQKEVKNGTYSPDIMIPADRAVYDDALARKQKAERRKETNAIKRRQSEENITRWTNSIASGGGSTQGGGGQTYSPNEVDSVLKP